MTGKVLNPHFKVRNLLAFNVVGFAAISFAVFLTASQPFYLQDVIGTAPKKIGAAVGTLGVVDEITAMVAAPLSGALVDRLNVWASTLRAPSGTRIVQLGSFLALGVSLLGYSKLAHRIFPDLWFFRALFAVGMCCAMSTGVVMLHEANNSDFEWAQFLFWRRPRVSLDQVSLAEYEDIDDDDEGFQGNMSAEGTGLDSLAAGKDLHRQHGKLAAMLGVATGLGAIFSASVYIPLPVRLAALHPDRPSSENLQVAYGMLGLIALAVGGVVFALGYDCVKQRGTAESEDKDSYWELLKEGVRISKDNRRLQLAYVGSFVARSTIVANAVFIPLLVFKYYSSTGQCSTDKHPRGEVPLKDTCYDGYIFLAILTGVAHTVSLVLTPLWGIMVDHAKCGYLLTLTAAAACGMVGSFGLCVLGHGSTIYDPRNAGCFIAVSFIGLSQLGVVITSMSLVSSAGHEHRVIGSISGLYSLSGAVGILLITKVGGEWSDHWVFGPFFILGMLNLVLAVFAWRV